jgi:hypothetical protein
MFTTAATTHAPSGAVCLVGLEVSEPYPEQK